MKKLFTTWDVLEFIIDSNRKAFLQYESNAKILADLKQDMKGTNREDNSNR